MKSGASGVTFIHSYRTRRSQQMHAEATDGAVRRHAISQATLALNHATHHDPQPPRHVSWVRWALHKRYRQLWTAPNRPGDPVQSAAVDARTSFSPLAIGFCG